MSNYNEKKKKQTENGTQFCSKCPSVPSPPRRLQTVPCPELPAPCRKALSGHWNMLSPDLMPGK